MLRSIKLRLCARALVYQSPLPPQRPPRRFISTASRVLEQEPEPSRELGTSAEQAEGSKAPYGNQYGAGPSRLPYDPPRQPARDGPPHHAQPRSPHKEAHALARVKSYLGGVTNITDEHVERILDPTRFAFDTLVRPDVHALFRHLLETHRPLLAARVMLRDIESLKAPTEEGLWKAQAVTSLFERATNPAAFGDEEDGDIRLVPQGTEDIEVLLPLLTALQRIRNPREARVYTYLIQRLCAEGLYDTAAKVYVELAEEWITEGRLALGADPQSFYEGGGPPREGRAEWELRSGLYKTWWKGVRTWVLPGEVLSPHDRLDLWHPRKLRLPERLRKFPMPIPTAPPSIVPHPTLQLMTIIADHLELDPETATAEAFQRSMRACAILASTILSRTIPYLPARLLRYVLDKTPTEPPVYPEHIKEPPTGEDAWAYTAYTHIHLAIRSVLLSPPTRPSLFKYMMEFDKAKSEGLPLPDIPERYKYQTAPLSFAACRFLIGYAVMKVQSVVSVKALYRYIRTTWGVDKMTETHAMLLRSFAPSKSPAALSIDRMLFGGTQLGIDAPPLSPARSPRIPTPFEQAVAVDGTDTIFDLPATPRGGQDVNPESLNALLRYLINTGQKDRFVDAVYRILPFLQYSRSSDPALTGDPEGMLDEDPDKPKPYNGRPQPTMLTSKLYGTIMIGLSRFGAFSLGQRIFQLALEAEREWSKMYLADENIPSEHRLPIDVFWGMLKLWRMLSRRAWKSDGPTAGINKWHIPPGYENWPVKDIIEDRVWTTYRAARMRWVGAMWDRTRDQMDTKLVGHSEPHERFFSDLIRARANTWGLANREQGFRYGLMTPPAGVERERADQPKEIRRMFFVADDLKKWGYAIPAVLQVRLGMIAPMTEQEVNSMTDSDVQNCVNVKRKVPHPKKIPVFGESPSVGTEVEMSPEEWNEIETTEREWCGDGGGTPEADEEKGSGLMAHV